MKKCSSINTQE